MSEAFLAGTFFSVKENLQSVLQALLLALLHLFRETGCRFEDETTQPGGSSRSQCEPGYAQARTCAAILPDRATAPPGRPLGALAGLVAGAAEKRFDWV